MDLVLAKTRIKIIKKNTTINPLFGNDTERTHLLKQIGSNCCRSV